MAKVYLSLGSNIGNSSLHLDNAEKAIEGSIGMIAAASYIYETEPWGFEHKSYFLNEVLLVETHLLPQELLKATQEIESKMGREKNKLENYSARIIDIDILFYDNLIINKPDLIIPHPHITKRNFVLIPLIDIAPDFIHPVLKCGIRELVEKCDDKSEIKMLN